MAKRRTLPPMDLTNLDEWTPVEINNEEKLTLLIAVCQIVEVVRDSKYDSRIYQTAARPISYIADLLSLTEKQAVVYAIVMDMYYDNQISTFDIGRCLNISPLKAMAFNEDLEELCNRKYLVENYDEDAVNKSYSVTKDAIVSLHTVKIEVQQNCFLAHDFERSEKE